MLSFYFVFVLFYLFSSLYHALAAGLDIDLNQPASPVDEETTSEMMNVSSYFLSR